MSCDNRIPASLGDQVARNRCLKINALIHSFGAVRHTCPAGGTTNGLRYSRVSIALALSLAVNVAVFASNASTGPTRSLVGGLSTPLFFRPRTSNTRLLLP